MVDVSSPNISAQGNWQFEQSGNQLQSLQRQFYLTPPKGANTVSGPSQSDLKKLKKSAQEFEAIFVQQVLEAMDKTVDRSDSILSGGNAEEMFRGMLNQNIALSISQRPGGSGFGLADAIYKQMSQAMTGGKQPQAAASQSQG